VIRLFVIRFAVFFCELLTNVVKKIKFEFKIRK